ncbi:MULTISPECIES: chemotaxis protein [Bacillus]|uniref:chemotaxis protein n=1 Tax=Bacillus TaxID=1386 RepID=UPI000BB8B270|nr:MULTISPECIES: chemotaxis protein [Bacillus]
MNNKREILLDTGTNEVEFLEFYLENSSFGINVLKVREIIQPIAVTKIPHAHPFIEGIVELRGEVLPVIKLRTALNLPDNSDAKNDKYIITEFNQMKIVLRVDHVTQIHRLTWEKMEKPTTINSGLNHYVTGVVKLEDKMMLLLDVEQVMYEIYPNLTKVNMTNEHKQKRNTKKVALAEDSPMLRQLLLDTLQEAGYTHVKLFENGAEAWHYFEEKVKEGKEKLDILITDIEMPQMDGHNLTRRIKEDQELKATPVIIFSSLISEQLRHKGNYVGADAQISKPEVSSLIQVMDEILKI